MTTPADSIRPFGESDRTPEFKTRREALVTDVNGWLEGLADKRDRGEPLEDGSVLSAEPRITQTRIGKMNRSMSLIGEEFQPGVSLTGDGQSQPYIFESVQPTASGNEVVVVQGSDPLAVMVRDGYTMKGQSEVVASFQSRTRGGPSGDSYFGYEIRGDGAVVQKFKNDDGVYRSVELRNTADVELAQEAFSNVRDGIPA